MITLFVKLQMVVSFAARIDMLQPQLVHVEGGGEMIAAQADIGDLHRQVFRELMLQRHVELLGRPGYPSSSQ